jgi:peptidoglycan/LPS O-acetylase OafA/YrhL
VNRTTRRFGHEPALDGLRALAVVAVVLYHVHALDPKRFSLFRGGFFGVELFFVVSGFLITALLLQELGETGTVDRRQFWLRRARRLLPAVVVLLVAIGISAVLWRRDTLGRFRRDLPWAVFYASNWGQIIDSGSGYFAQLSTPPLLRHLWSLAVEEQWYLVWPLVFGPLARRFPKQIGRLLAAVGVAAALLGIAIYNGTDSRANFVYLSTFTRASGLLFGAALAAVWQPWRSASAQRRALPVLDFITAAGLVVFVVVVARWSSTSSIVYRGGMLFVSLLSVVLIALVTHPGARRARKIIGSPALVAIGRRSYGLYLWHWPILVLTNAVSSTARLLVVFVLIVAATETSYRFVEQPFRAGLLGQWWNSPHRPRGERVAYGIAAFALVAPLLLVVGRARTTDIVVGGASEKFDASILKSTAAADVADSAATSGVTDVATTVAAPSQLRVVLVGDSQAESLAKNVPAGIEEVFTITDGSVDGCGVWDDGEIWSRLDQYKRANKGCAGWPTKWAQSVVKARAEVALVTVGAWDVFDIAYTSGVTKFNTPEWDAKFTSSLNKGIAAVVGAGAKVALLEVACFNPVQAKGAVVPPFPERGEPWRTQHVNQLLRAVAAADPSHVSFVAGPVEWCNGSAVAISLDYRWDGVHVYRPGAKLVFDTIAPALLALKP